MSGRFTRMYSWRELVELYKLGLQSPPSNLEPRFNICPTDTIDMIVEHDGVRQLVPMRWGLVPGWCPDSEVRNNLLHALRRSPRRVRRGQGTDRAKLKKVAKAKAAQQFHKMKRA
jgi:putative SOS response-associated peptidase YedK